MSSEGGEQRLDECVVVDQPLALARESLGDLEARAHADMLLQEVVASEPATARWKAIVEFKTTESPLGVVSYGRVSVLHETDVQHTKKSSSALHIGEIDLHAVRELMRAATSDTLDSLPREPLERRVRNVLLGPQAAGMLLHEVFGHGLELDNIRRGWGLPLDVRFPEGITISEVSGGPESVAARFDEDGVPCEPGPLVEMGRIVALIGRAGDDHQLPVLPRARSADWRHSPIGRSTDLVMTSEHCPLTHADLSAAADLTVAEVDNARLRHGSGTVEMDFSQAERTAPDTTVSHTLGGRITLSLHELANASFTAGTERDRSLALCDKGGQRIPISVAAQELLLQAVRIDPT